MQNRIRGAALLLAAAVSVGTFSSNSFAAAGNAAQPSIGNMDLYEVHTLAGSGAFDRNDGSSASSAFREPTSLLYSAKSGSYLVADARNQMLRGVTAAATTTTSGLYIGADEYNAPLGSLLDGDAAKAAFNLPSGLAADSDGVVYIADTGNNSIRSLSATGVVRTVAGTGGIGSDNGAAANASFYHPLDIAVNKEGVIYVADTLNHVIRQIKDGQVTTLNAPSKRIIEYYPGAIEAVGDYADGPLAQAKFNEPSGLALDSSGNLYVSDTGNNRIRYIDFKTNSVTTVAGGVTSEKLNYDAGSPYSEGGFADGAAATAELHAPRGLAVTPDGGLLIADSLNHAIRYLASGKVTTLAGTPQEEGIVDGIARYSAFNRPTDVEWVGGGAFAVADSGSNTVRIVAPYASPTGVKADGSIHLLYNSVELNSDVTPVIQNNVTFVPVRVLTEKLGFKVQYANGQTVLGFAGTTYTVKNGSTQVVKQVEGGSTTTVTLPKAPIISNNRQFLPVRFFAEELGLDVQWLSDLRAVLLRDKQFTK
ncbi:stalk domain-containing protein [Paenibacillus sp. OV219]|uniref:NHL domain-containing protein n=1 Tax=Paenibacillus sp. OV219 TaxID=1884377 RepID=UPI0008B3E889|nr:stalk domain-containing protein [Paenibacillus sp. OV219]SEM70594.1 NHL repeat-containing protein [Paenibacillus sp. OV219]